MRRIYLHERPDWPLFHWNQEALTNLLAAVRYRQGRLSGRMAALGFDLRQEATLRTLTEDVLKTSDIEGETLDIEQVRSSLARRLGIDSAGPCPADGPADAPMDPRTDRAAEGIVRMTLDAASDYASPLTAERLWAWHAWLFPDIDGYSRPITVGAWRDDHTGPMQVVSGPIGRERVHFEAPPAERIDEEMARFLEWFNESDEMDGVIRAGQAHLWFVAIHPFDDGNGRIARALADMALARSEQSPQRFYSMSSQIREERAGYYKILEATQQGSMDVSVWMYWFLDCLGRAIDRAETTLDAVLDKDRFWERVAGLPFNERQRDALARLLDDFKGKLTSSKWAKLAKCSQDTALRDIKELIAWGVLLRNPGGGRSASYKLADFEAPGGGQSAGYGPPDVGTSRDAPRD